MRRNKAWWARLTPGERSALVNIERSQNLYYKHDGYLPDDCSECSACGDITSGGNLCGGCLKQVIYIIDKADGKIKGMTDKAVRG